MEFHTIVSTAGKVCPLEKCHSVGDQRLTGTDQDLLFLLIEKILLLCHAYGNMPFFKNWRRKLH